MDDMVMIDLRSDTSEDDIETRDAQPAQTEERSGRSIPASLLVLLLGLCLLGIGITVATIGPI